MDAAFVGRALPEGDVSPPQTAGFDCRGGRDILHKRRCIKTLRYERGGPGRRRPVKTGTDLVECGSLLSRFASKWSALVAI